MIRLATLPFFMQPLSFKPTARAGFNEANLNISHTEEPVCVIKFLHARSSVSLEPAISPSKSKLISKASSHPGIGGPPNTQASDIRIILSLPLILSISL